MSAGCAVVVAATLWSARRYAWENDHLLPAVERDFGRRYAPATFELVGGDFDSTRDLLRAERGDPSRWMSLIEVVAGPPGAVTLDGVALSPNEAAEVLTSRRKLWQVLNPEREFPGELALYSDGTRPLPDVAGALRSALTGPADGERDWQLVAGIELEPFFFGRYLHPPRAL